MKWVETGSATFAGVLDLELAFLACRGLDLVIVRRQSRVSGAESRRLLRCEHSSLRLRALAGCRGRRRSVSHFEWRTEVCGGMGREQTPLTTGVAIVGSQKKKTRLLEVEREEEKA
jgi:hypothetical protein